MTEQAHVEPAPFDAYAAFKREREYTRQLEATLERALVLLAFRSDKLAVLGEDETHIRDFIVRAKNLRP